VDTHAATETGGSTDQGKLIHLSVRRHV
jgi:hypothetical protein